MSNLSRKFATSSDKENKGIRLSFGEVVFTAKRMGGSNKAYVRFMDDELKKYRQAIQRNQMDVNVLFELQVKGFCQHCLIRVDGLTEDDGTAIKPEDKERVYTELMKPELEDTTLLIMAEFSKPGNFTLYDLEDDAKNLPKP